MGDFKDESMPISAIDPTSVKQAYETEKSENIDGVIRADILIGGSAIIDYKNNSLFLLKVK